MSSAKGWFSYELVNKGPQHTSQLEHKVIFIRFITIFIYHLQSKAIEHIVEYIEVTHLATIRDNDMTLTHIDKALHEITTMTYGGPN